MPVLSVELNEIPDGGAKILDTGGRLRVAVFRVGERLAAIDNRCPHAGGALGDGRFDGTMVQCPLHGFRVDVWKGIGNAGKPVTRFAVAVIGSQVQITIPEPDP